MVAPPAYPATRKPVPARLKRKLRKKHPHFIQGAIKHPGALHRDLGVPSGQKIPAGQLAAAAHQPGKVGARARFAQTLASLRH